MLDPHGSHQYGRSSGRRRQAGQCRPGDNPNAHAVPRDQAEGNDDKRPAFSSSTGPCPKCRPVHIVLFFKFWPPKHTSGIGVVLTDTEERVLVASITPDRDVFTSPL